jgi:DNA topoisomerase-2
MAKTTTLSNNNVKSLEQRSLKSFLDSELKDFAFYVIQTRSSPSLYDGMRVGARKIIWSLILNKYDKDGKISKLLDLVGSSMKLHYNHGGTSLENTVVQLASEHVFKQCPISMIGQIGDLRTKSKTAARYLNFTTSKWLDLFKYDLNLLDLIKDEGAVVEPTFFLPIIPIILLYRTNAPGFGFSYKSMSYDINDIIDCCLKVLTDGSCYLGENLYALKPDINEIKPENWVFNSNKNVWYNVGNFKLDFNRDILTITDLPYTVSYDKYDKILQTLIDNNFIDDYSDLSQNGDMQYEIKFSTGRLKQAYNDKWKFYNMFKLYCKVPDDILNCIDETGKRFITFESAHQLIDCFVEKRLKYYFKRKEKIIQELEEKLRDLKEKMLFIQLVVDDKIIVNKRKQSLIKLDLDRYNISYEVLKLTIGRLTADEIEKLANEIKNVETELEDVKETPEKTMYIQDLIDLKRKYCEIIKMK